MLRQADVRVVAVCDVNRGSHGYARPEHFLGREPGQKRVNEFYAKGNRSGKYKGCDAYRDFRDVLARDDVDAVIGVEARGFIFAAAASYKLGCGLLIVRKPGKLPAATVSESYALEYGTDTLEIHRDAVRPGMRLVLIDDLLATGGTLAATARLVERLGGKVVGIRFLIELTFLAGRSKLKGYDVRSIIKV